MRNFAWDYFKTVLTTENWGITLFNKAKQLDAGESNKVCMRSADSILPTVFIWICRHATSVSYLTGSQDARVWPGQYFDDGSLKKTLVQQDLIQQVAICPLIYC